MFGAIFMRIPLQFSNQYLFTSLQLKKKINFIKVEYIIVTLAVPIKIHWSQKLKDIKKFYIFKLFSACCNSEGISRTAKMKTGNYSLKFLVFSSELEILYHARFRSNPKKTSAKKISQICARFKKNSMGFSKFF